MVGVTTSNELIQFDSATPGTIGAPVAVTGLVSGDFIQGIDFRPASGVLYALAISGGTGRIYAIDTDTAVATLIGAAPFSTTLAASAYGFDFNPAADRIRVTSSADENLRVNPDTGALAGTDTGLDNLADSEQIVGAAYDRNDRNPGTLTTLFGIDFSRSPALSPRRLLCGG